MRRVALFLLLIMLSGCGGRGGARLHTVYQHVPYQVEYGRDIGYFPYYGNYYDNFTLWSAGGCLKITEQSTLIDRPIYIVPRTAIWCNR